LEAAQRLGVEPATCVAVEDSAAGVESARAAGMIVIAVASTLPAERLGRARIVVRDLTGVRAALRGVLPAQEA
jgi:sugar-phosphatase